jgi:hypothetical protein
MASTEGGYHEESDEQKSDPLRRKRIAFHRAVSPKTLQQHDGAVRQNLRFPTDPESICQTNLAISFVDEPRLHAETMKRRIWFGN